MCWAGEGRRCWEKTEPAAWEQAWKSPWNFRSGDFFGNFRNFHAGSNACFRECAPHHHFLLGTHMARFANILETIGNTPLVRLNKLAPPNVNLYVKIEA